MIKTIILLLFVFIISTTAQFDFGFSGYAVNMSIYQAVKDYKIIQLDDQYLNLSRLRLRPTINFSDNLRFNLEYEINSLYMTQSGFGLFEQNSISTRRQLVVLNWIPVNKKHLVVNHFIDRLSFRYEFNLGNIEIGRQRISWGTGRIWNPTDLFNPINPANFAKLEKDGADAVSAMFHLGSFTDLNVVYNPTNDFRNSNYGFRFRTNYSGYDFAVIAGFFDNRIVTGFDFAGNLFDAGVRGEGILSFNKDNTNDNFAKFILGADYQFSPEIYSLIEYHFNGEGKLNSADYELNRVVNAEILNLSRNYLFGMISYLVTPLFSINFSYNSNLNDGSTFFNITGNYSLTSALYITVGAQISQGDDSDEYWYYPNSFYLQGDIYF